MVLYYNTTPHSDDECLAQKNKKCYAGTADYANAHHPRLSKLTVNRSGHAGICCRRSLVHGQRCKPRFSTRKQGPIHVWKACVRAHEG